MPYGDSDKVYRYMRQLADDARSTGKTVVCARVGDVRDILELKGNSAAGDVVQAFETKEKLKEETGLQFLSRTGSGWQLDSIFLFSVT